MQVLKKAFAHMGAVIRGMLFIGFTVQILLGLAWMCRNFGQVQGFGEPDSALYGGLFRLLGGIPQLLYLLQLAAAFLAGDFFLKSFPGERSPAGGKGRFWGLWRGLALLAYPFAMQCHMAVQPFSFMGSLFLVMLSLLIRIPKKRLRQAVGNLALAAVCAGLFVLLSGALDASGREGPGNSFEAAAASRFAWPTIWHDRGNWTEDLRETVEDVLWEVSYYPENMKLLESALEERVGAEAARAYYRQMAEVAWRIHAPMIIRQIGWDVLGYTVTPVIFQLQLQGEAYDSYTGRNYEIMRGNSPVLTRNYVNYGCWWFGAAFFLSLPAMLAAAAQGASGIGKRLKALAYPAAVCLVCSGILVGLLTMRGAGLMDYKYTALISQLWIFPALFFAEGKGKASGTHAERKRSGRGAEDPAAVPGEKGVEGIGEATVSVGAPAAGGACRHRGAVL